MARGRRIAKPFPPQAREEEREMEAKDKLIKKLKNAVRGKTVINMLDVNKLGKAAISYLSSTEN